MKKLIFCLCLTMALSSLTACSKPSTSAVQTRNDLTREHFEGLTSGMKRNDVIDLIGENDEALASKEDFDVYSLSDGTTAVHRYQDDVLQSAFIRDADNFEDSLFNIFERPAADTNNTDNTNDINDMNNTNDANDINDMNNTNDADNTTDNMTDRVTDNSETTETNESNTDQ